VGPRKHALDGDQVGRIHSRLEGWQDTLEDSDAACRENSLIPLLLSLQFRDRRCISKAECLSMTSVSDVAGGKSRLQRQAWKVRDDGVCDVRCPPGNYTESLTDPHVCVKCVGSCPKGLNRVRSVIRPMIVSVALSDVCFHFQKLSPSPFTMGAGNWPRILKLGHNI